jgi:drug/metabolite transporter (DMT)-like permease
LPTAAIRVAIASLFLLPLLLAKGHWVTLRQHWKPVLFVGVLNSGVPFALFSFAVMHITTGFSSILNATVPLFGALVAWAWLGDKPSLSRTVGLGLGFGGVLLLGLFVISCGTQRFHLANAGANGWAGRCLSLDMRK